MPSLASNVQAYRGLALYANNPLEKHFYDYFIGRFPNAIDFPFDIIRMGFWDDYASGKTFYYAEVSIGGAVIEFVDVDLKLTDEQRQACVAYTAEEFNVTRRRISLTQFQKMLPTDEELNAG